MDAPAGILELRSVKGTGGGPEKTIFAGAALADASRYAVTVCYIRDARDGDFRIQNRNDRKVVDYVELTERHSLDVSVLSQLHQLVLERGIDLIHAHDYKTDLLALLAARSTRVVPLATAHGWTGHSWRERRVYYPADRRLLARFPAVIAVSDDIRNQLIDAGAAPARVRTILNGIDADAFRRTPGRQTDARARLGFGPADVVLGAVGRLEPQKRFDVLIDLCATLQDRWPRLRLAVAGDGSLRTQLEARARAKLPTGSWRFVGHTDDVTGFHHGIDMLVQTSDYEGTPNAVLEAMALETPCVATAAGGTDQLAADGEHALIVPVGAFDQLAQRVESCLLDPAAARRRAVAARRHVETDLSFERRVRRVESVYADLLATRDRRPESRRQVRIA